jgi:hypothetical protein
VTRHLKYAQEKQPSFSTRTRAKDKKNPYLLCSATTVVYSLNEHEWYFVAMKNSNDPTWKENAWDSLVKAKSQVDLMQRFKALTAAHLKQKDLGNQSIDNFKGKSMLKSQAIVGKCLY